jgi:hypothetical protein
VWQETQNVTVSPDGQYSALLGATLPDGLPVDVFTSQDKRWLEVHVERSGEPTPQRVQLASVPYALHAANADTLGGQPASAYMLNPAAGRDGTGSTSTTAIGGETATPQVVVPGSTGSLAKYLNNGDNLGPTTISELGGRVGINTGTALPADYLHIKFNDAFGAFAGLAVQNLSGSANASSGMLFFDQNGALAQFQGFGNFSHEYRINNIAAGGSINFLTANVSRFTVASNGNVGIGTAAPVTKLQVAGDVTVDGNIGAKYQDVAEWVETASPLEAGTVVIVDPTQPNRVQAAAKAYDARVAGAVSRQPGLVLGERSDSRVMVAQSGRVRIKADARHGAIRIGDLLVTSPTPGHAMRSRPIKMGAQSMHRPGTLVGKALEALPSGKGEILVLLTLQ